MTDKELSEKANELLSSWFIPRHATMYSWFDVVTMQDVFLCRSVQRPVANDNYRRYY